MRISDWSSDVCSSDLVAAGANGLIHVSAIGADPQSPSAYGRSKGEGEAAVLAACPTATIIRPSVIFGQEDQFTNRLAQMMSLPVVLVMGANTKFQPIYAADVGRSEEHTSELQSLMRISYAVFCLKKKNTT